MNLFLDGQSLTNPHLETIFDVVKVVKVLQVSVTSLFQEVLFRLRSGLGMYIFSDTEDNFTMCSNNSDTVIVKFAIVFDGWALDAQFLQYGHTAVHWGKG